MDVDEKWCLSPFLVVDDPLLRGPGNGYNPARLAPGEPVTREKFGGLAMAAAMAIWTVAAPARGADLPGPVDARAWRDARDLLMARTRMEPPTPATPIRELRRYLRTIVPQAVVTGTVRVQHLDGDVTIDPTGKRIDAVLRETVNFVDAGTSAFRLMSFLPIAGIETTDGMPVTWTAETVQGYPMALVTLTDIPAKGASRDFVVRLSGVPDCQMSGPISVNLCAWGRVIYVAGDLFLPGALGDDFATADLRITMPAGYTIAATGVVTSVTPAADGMEVHHVEQPFPSDARSFGISLYQEARIPWGTGYIGTYTDPADARAQDGVPEILTDMKNVLEYYSARIGAFQFPKMEACQVTNDAGAAFGWPALLWIPDGMLRHAGTGRTALFAHELGHQWFPDMIKSNDNWAAWLSEGFAEYLSTEYMGTVVGADYPTAVYNSYGEMYMYFIPDAQDYGLSSMDSQYVSDSSVYQVVTYYKGAIVCHILEKYVGTDVWNQALRAMYDALAGKEAYYTTYDFKAYLEAAAGRDLTDVFMNWVFKKGFPTYTVDVTRTMSDAGAPRATVRVRQVSSTKYNDFKMPVQLALVTEAGETLVEVAVDVADQTFTFDLDSRLVRVRFDPARNFLKHVNPGLPGDMDLSGEIDGIDLMYTAWAQGSSAYGYSDNFHAAVDFDRNAQVDEVDLALVTDGFGRSSEGGAP